ncbi:ketopantoate reductase family protein [Desmospora profundinema]|uniref:2-dehydropantoate 2-reductase n=1 Tax=Desmospora profundinema TaxID=1571184 RepID=A0ABU1IMB9_9BACL|nr:ketopantoate reductase family protein [Desmospora profundinema]MDR6225927.1 2-dehydropantoate 2-reductase [Desmospora profundinema]
MRILVVGAGAVGGYFGGRLAEAGRDVTFLVRERRRQELKERGLVIRSVHGDWREAVSTVVSGEAADPFDLVLLAVKAYYLEASIRDLEPYIGEETRILPLLNGVIHLDRLREVFGEERVLGGLCFIETTLNAQGEVEQYSERHDLFYGALTDGQQKWLHRLDETFAGVRAEVRRSDDIRREVWKKYLFIATFSGITSLMGSAIGPVRETASGLASLSRLFSDIVTAASVREPELVPSLREEVWRTLVELEPSMKSSMLRDMEKGTAVEVDHLHGSLLDLTGPDTDLSLLRAVVARLKVYETVRRMDK